MTEYKTSPIEVKEICEKLFKMIKELNRIKQFNRKVEMNIKINSFKAKHKVTQEGTDRIIYFVNGIPAGHKVTKYAKIPASIAGCTNMVKVSGYTYETF